MTLVRSVHDPDWDADYSTLVVRECGRGGDHVDDEPLGEHVEGASLTGRLALAGQGWLRARTRSGYLDVELALHDAPPPADALPPGVQLLESPYLSTSGEVALDSLVSMAPSTTLELAGPGRYRVRVRREVRDEDERWVLSFWPEQDGDLPRWYAVGPAARPRGAAASWRSVLPYDAVELLMPLQGEVRSMSAEQYAEVWRRHGRRRGWLDDLLVPPRPELTCGFPDLDAESRTSHERYAAERRAVLADLAQQLEVPVPQTRRDLLPLLVAAGLLSRTADGYAIEEDPPAPEEVLHLPAAHLSREQRQRQQEVHGDLAADVERVVLWAPGRVLRTTHAALQERLLATAPQLRGALAYAVSQGRLVVEDDGELVLSLGSGTPAEPEPAWQRRDEDAYADVTTWRDPREQPPLPAGAPPRWGVVSDGRLWREGADPVPLDDPYWDRGRHTVGGTLLLGTPRAVLVDGSGVVHELGGLSPVALDATGAVLAGVEARYGRKRATFRLHLVDLATRERTTMPWPLGRDLSAPAFTRDGDVLFRAEVDPEDPSSYGGALFRWRPGSDPVPEPDGDEPTRSGLLLRRDDTGLHLTWPSGATAHAAVDASVSLSPAGSCLYRLRSDPPALAVWDLSEGRISGPRVVALPQDASAHEGGGPGTPAWESARHLLLMARDEQVRVLRVDVLSGRVEQSPLPGSDPYGPRTLVEGPPEA